MVCITDMRHGARMGKIMNLKASSTSLCPASGESGIVWQYQNGMRKIRMSRARHGLPNKWHETMEETILEFLDWFAEGTYEIRLLKKETLENVVFKGKTQCIIKLPVKESA